MSLDPDSLPIVDDEITVLDQIVGLGHQQIIELGCGPAALVRRLLARFPGCRATALEVDAIQHAKNLAQPQERLSFVAAGAQSIPFPDASFDLAIMLKSLHHVPTPLIAQAIGEAARVLRPGGHLYVSEPIYGGAFNGLIRLFNDEGVVRAAAQRELDQAVAADGPWSEHSERRFALDSVFSSFEDFETKQMRPSYADHQLDDARIAQVRAAFEPHLTARGARFARPLHVRLLRRRPA